MHHVHTATGPPEGSSPRTRGLGFSCIRASGVPKSNIIDIGGEGDLYSEVGSRYYNWVKWKVVE